jgi:aspartate dehydrogenase
VQSAGSTHSRRRAGGLDQVVLTSSKPPTALAGAPFFVGRPIDLTRMRERTVLFEGSATEAIGHSPANVNVAAAVSLAGIGPERTLVRVVADPTLARNVHELEARGAFGELRLRFENLPSRENARTSMLACLSPLAVLRRLAGPIRIG